MLAYQENPDASFEKLAPLARDRIHQGILNQLIFPVEFYLSSELSVIPADGQSVLIKQMKARQVDTALVFSINGKIEKEHTLMWEGISLLEVQLKIVQFTGNELRTIKSYQIKPQKYPMKRWREGQAYRIEHLAKNANKIVNKWSEQQINQFLSNLSQDP